MNFKEMDDLELLLSVGYYFDKVIHYNCLPQLDKK